MAQSTRKATVGGRQGFTVITQTSAKQRAIQNLAIVVCSVTLFFPGCGREQNSKPADEDVLRIKTPSISSSAVPTSPAIISPINFRTIGVESGFDFQRFDDISPKRRIIEVNGGGVGVIDFDLDGYEDIFMPNGCQRPFLVGDSATPGKLFRNQREMKFGEVSQESMLIQHGYKHGCAVGDWDADGFDDLYLTAFGNNEFWRNNGDGTFSQVASEVGASVPEWSSSAAFADINQDGWLDLYVVNYLAESDEAPTLCPNPASPDGYEGCSPAILDGVSDRLFLSNGDWAATDVTHQSGLANFEGKGLGVVIVDLDNDQRPEIFVANDGQENHLFQPVPTTTNTSDQQVNFKLTENGFTANVALNETGYAQAGMGVAAGDYDRNGTPDLFLTHFFGDTNTLYGNNGRLFFEDLTRRSGLGPASRNFLGFGTSFVDIDNDGWQDLLVANGHVDDREWMPGGQPYRMPAQCFHNTGDSAFQDVSVSCGDYFSNKWLGRGLAVADLDKDGRTDVVVSHQLDQSLILKNETTTENRSVELRLIGTQSNRNGIGATAIVKDVVPVIKQDSIGGGSFQSASSQKIRVGVGKRTRISIEIRWPSGRTQLLENLQPGSWAVVEGHNAIPETTGTFYLDDGTQD